MYNNVIIFVMKILLTGGGSGGHFYPVIAVAAAIRKVAKAEKILDPEIYYLAPRPYDKRALFDLGIIYRRTTAGKIRRYFSLLNIIDIFKAIWGSFKAVFQVYSIYPDVIFGKGGFVSFPVMFAARLLRIPVIIHESDTVPGKVNKWAGKFATKIALSFPEAAEYFPKDKVALTGNPIRNEILHPVREGSRDFLKIEENLPIVLILGGSQGAQLINEHVIDALPVLLEKYYVLHQTGAANYKITTETVNVVLQNNDKKYRYRPYDNLDPLTLRMAAGAASIVVSRAGSTIFEIAAWGLPSILIPITSSNGDHQRKNAFSYARTGAAVVIEEANLSSHILRAEIDRILEREEENQKMIEKTAEFRRLDAAEKIAHEIISIGLEHDLAH